MKNLLQVAAIVATLFAFLPARAQYVPKEAQKQQTEKALLFAQLPPIFNMNTNLLQNIFTINAFEKIMIPVSPGIFFEGTVLEKVRTNDHVVNMNIRSSNFAGALMTISKITFDDQTVNYLGRIINIRYSDAFVLKKVNGQFVFVKEKQAHVVTE